MGERRTFIIRVHGDASLILEDVATGERVRLPDVGAIPHELRRRLHDSTADAAGDPRDGSAATPKEGP